MKDRIILYYQQYEAIKCLDIHEKGVLLESIFEYSINGKLCECANPVVNMAFSFFKQQIDQDTAKYEQKCRRNSENARQRVYSKSQTGANGNDRMRSHKEENNSFNEKEKQSGVALSSPLRVEYEKIKELYHTVCVSFPRLQALTEDRKRKIKLRVGEIKKAYPDSSYLDIIKTIFEKLEDSPFCKGDNIRGWKVSFDWIFTNGTNWVKIMEGRYNEQKPKETEYLTFD